MNFEKISNTIYADFYIMEVWSISNSILTLKERLFNTTTYKNVESKKGNNILDPSTEPHEIISSIINHSSRLDKLFHSSNIRNGETESDYTFRKERSKFLRKLLLHKKKNTHEIFKSGVRNGIEHFDERVDLMNSKILSNDKQLNEKCLLYNITLSSKRVFLEWNKVLPFKVYIVDSGEYFMTDHFFEEQVVLLHEIFDEVLRIQNNCVAWAAKRPDRAGEIMDRPSGVLKTPRHEI